MQNNKSVYHVALFKHVLDTLDSAENKTFILELRACIVESHVDQQNPPYCSMTSLIFQFYIA